MQEEVENRVVTLVVNAGKLTEQELRKALAAALHGQVVERKDGLHLGIETQGTCGGVLCLVGMDGGEEVDAIDFLELHTDMVVVTHGIGDHL